QGILDEAGLVAPRNGTAVDPAGAVKVAEAIGYPVLVRPSFVLGGRGMEIVYDTPSLEDYFRRMEGQVVIAEGYPLLVDRFLDDAVEIDIDALYDGEQLYVGGVMEHIEEAGIHSGDSSCTLPPVTLGRDQIERVRQATHAIASGLGVRGRPNVQVAAGAVVRYVGGVMEHIEEAGIHSGDSSCTLPPVTLGRDQIERVREETHAIAAGLGVRGLLNVQFAIGAGVLYVLEASPRASRTVPFVAKATGTQIAKAAARIMVEIGR